MGFFDKVNNVMIVNNQRIQGKGHKTVGNRLTVHFLAIFLGKKCIFY